MTQTLQALFAFVLLLTSGLGMQRNHIASQTAQIRSEVELRATGVAAELFDTFAVLDFDAAGTVATASDLTAPGQFGGVAKLSAATDLDDLDGMKGQVMLATGGGAMTYEWTATVRYVEVSAGGFASSASQTHMKEVELAIAGPANVTLTTNRIYSYNG